MLPRRILPQTVSPDWTTSGSPGSHTADDAWRRTGTLRPAQPADGDTHPAAMLENVAIDAAAPGYCGLGRAVNALGLSSPNLIEMDIVVSPPPRVHGVGPGAVLCLHKRTNKSVHLWAP